MSDSSASLESTETRVAAAKADIRAQACALEFRVRQLVKSPYVIAGLVIGAATAPKRNPSAFPLVIPQPGSAAPGSAAAVPQGNWLSQQWQMIKAAVRAWVDDYAPSMGAALSYYTLFSLAPLLIIVIAVAGMVFGQEAAQGEIVAQLRGIMGGDGAVAVEGMLKAAR